MSSSNTLKKKKGHHKTYNRPDVPSGMLDAYMDTETSETSSKATLKPVSTKNKNKKKLEQRKMAEEEAAKEKERIQPEEVVILDSWEDYDPDFEPEVHLPPPPSKPPAGTTTKNNGSSKAKSGSASQKVSALNVKPSLDEEAKKTKEALTRLNETISKMSSLFVDKNPVTNSAKKSNSETNKETPKENMSKPGSNSTLPSQKNEKNSVAKKEENSTGDNVTSSNKDQNKSKEDVKAEREAKKAAKAARRAVAKGDAPQPTLQPEKKPLQVNEAESGSKKSNAELKAERRAKQEAQRAAKAAATLATASTEKTPETKPKSSQPITSDPLEKKVKKRPITAEIIPTKNNMRKVMLFSHLPIYERNSSFKNNLPLVNGEIHPVILQLGLQYSMGTISGSNARCVSLMHALKRIISDYVTPPQKELSRDLDASLKPYISFLTNCRTLSVSMENALRYVRTKIRRIDPSISDEEAKNQLIEEIDDFIHLNIVLASKQISMTAREKIKDGDVILTYGHSSLVRSVFVYAAQSGAKFRVIVADSRPKFEGKEMVRHLVNAGIKCTYVLISAVPYIIREVSKVIVGASSILANGTVNSRVGTSQVALIAKASNVPVLVCCETYKFSERVQTDSFVFNELGDPNDLVSPNDPLKDWQNIPKLNLLNLCYDITPACLVDAIISEISVIPGTSVPVVLRLKNSEANIK